MPLSSLPPYIEGLLDLDAGDRLRAAVRPLTFDAELAPELLGELFADVEVERWDAPLPELPSRRGVLDYLIGKGSAPSARTGAEITDVPLSVTKRGALARAQALTRPHSVAAGFGSATAAITRHVTAA
jgi:hypothetical protein